MTFRPFDPFLPNANKSGIPWNGRSAPVQKYRYFPAFVKKWIAFLSSGARHSMELGGWRRKNPLQSCEARRRLLTGILKTNARGVEGVRPPDHVFELAAHRSRMNARLVARQNADFQRRKAKASAGSW